MARTAQAFTVGIESGTFAEYILLDGGGRGILPIAKMVFRGSATLDGSGVGDTADCRITFPLPKNVVWQLATWHFSAESGINGLDYDEALLELFYAPAVIAFGASTQLNFGVLRSEPANLISVLDVSNYIVGNLLQKPGETLIVSTSFNEDVQSPFALLSYQDESQGANPVLWLSAGTQTDVDSNVVRFSIMFLGYTFEQANSALMYTGLDRRP